MMSQHISIVDAAALNFSTGRWGTCVNGQTFQQEGLLTCGDHQYATWFSGDGTLAIGRRHMDATDWETIHFADYALMPLNDAHNVASLGICPADGSIHLAFDHHVHPLHYRRSIAGLALEPARHAWTHELFGPITDALVPGQPLHQLTYPQFLATPDGCLQLLYRLGWSGDGDWHLAEYAPGTGWRQLGMLLARHGRYRHSLNRCAYPNPLRYASDGSLHLTWSWREGVEPRDLSTNHDLLYAQSLDLGRTWLDGTGRTIATLPESAISIDTAGILALPTAFGWGQMNTTTQHVDRQGRVHVVSWLNPRDASGSSLDMNTWIYLHCWRDAHGVWHENRLPFNGRKPQLVVDDQGTAYLVSLAGAELNYHGLDHGGQLHIARASAASGWTDWRDLDVPAAWFVGEPLLDPVRWLRDRMLSIYIQGKPAAVGHPSPLQVIDIATTA
jgi:hypothetical protein